MKVKLSYTLLLLISLLINACASVDSLVKEKKYFEAEKYCNDAEKKDQKSCFNTIAEGFYQNKNYEKALQFFKKGEDNSGIVKSYDKLGYQEYSLKNYTKSLNYFSKSSNSEMINKCNDHIGESLFNRNLYSLAVVKFNKSGNITKEKECYNLIAKNYLKKKNYISSAIYFDKAQNFIQSKKAYNKVAYSYYKKKNYILAAMYYGKGGNLRKQKKSYGKQANYYYKKKMYTSAEIYYTKSGNKRKAKMVRKKNAKNKKLVSKLGLEIFTSLDVNYGNMRYNKKWLKHFVKKLKKIKKRHGSTVLYQSLTKAKLISTSRALSILKRAINQYSRGGVSNYDLNRSKKYTNITKIINSMLTAPNKKKRRI